MIPCSFNYLALRHKITNFPTYDNSVVQWLTEIFPTSNSYIRLSSLRELEGKYTSSILIHITEEQKWLWAPCWSIFKPERSGQAHEAWGPQMGPKPGYMLGFSAAVSVPTMWKLRLYPMQKPWAKPYFSPNSEAWVTLAPWSWLFSQAQQWVCVTGSWAFYASGWPAILY